MAENDERVSIIIMQGGGEEPRTFDLSRRRVRMFQVLAVGLGLMIVGMTASWASIARRAARAGDLEHQNDSLLARHGRMDSLAARIAVMEEREAGIRLLFGISESQDSALWLGSPGSATGAKGSLAAGNTDTEPTAWPLTTRGFVTQSDGAEGDHPGIDIAVPTGSYVRASGGGEVVDAANDPVYGLFVLIDHGNGIRSRYGHASYLVAERGWRVRQGEVIALSGSTGRSTAPHLHFEILLNGRPIDPLSMVTPP